MNKPICILSQRPRTVLIYLPVEDHHHSSIERRTLSHMIPQLKVAKPKCRTTTLHLQPPISQAPLDSNTPSSTCGPGSQPCRFPCSLQFQQRGTQKSLCRLRETGVLGPVNPQLRCSKTRTCQNDLLVLINHQRSQSYKSRGYTSNC